ncbi:hypothetical protein QJ856_gp0986 [Tupanvirus deep ocean]|uniref:Uncharacterized protein n=2 Tax=Tupanvirus TaxID=2094720 RepID=A0AC62A7P8_9VIRU|nr:hypothetical protein QJ856_gp0986 [Tupanvirus deep ocean]QKU33771.1 hypothetical protein [Tupanvirus deep ocean]
MNILIEDEWNAHDIIEYCQENNLQYRVLSQKEITKLCKFEFFEGPFFCDTKIAQKYLHENGWNDKIPDTYPEIFNKFYKRNIKKIKFNELNKQPYPFFIKSISNNKQISGTVISNHKEENNLWLINDIIPYTDMELYVSNVVKFIVEYRLLIGNGKLYGKGYQQGNKFVNLDDKFTKEIIGLCGNNFYCMDVGLLSDINEWAIVEVNPPFSLDDYDIPLDNYIEYAIEFWKSLK